MSIRRETEIVTEDSSHQSSRLFGSTLMSEGSPKNVGEKKSPGSQKEDELDPSLFSSFGLSKRVKKDPENPDLP